MVACRGLSLSLPLASAPASMQGDGGGDGECLTPTTWFNVSKCSSFSSLPSFVFSGFRHLVPFAVAAAAQDEAAVTPVQPLSATADTRDNGHDKISQQNFFMLDNYRGGPPPAEEHHEDTANEMPPKMGGKERAQAPPQPMGALYEDVENFFGDIFAWYGQFVARWPHLFVIIPFVTCGLLGLGLFNLEYETHVEHLYTPIGSRAAKDQAYLQDMYIDTSAYNFYLHQQVLQPTYGEVIIVINGSGTYSTGNSTGSEENAHSDDDSVLSAHARDSIRQLYDFVYNVSIWNDGVLLSYPDVCAMRAGKCVVDGDHLIGNDVCVRPNETDLNEQVLAGISYDNGCVSAASLKLRFNLRHNSTDHRELSLKWEQQYLRELENFHVDGLDFAYTVSESLDLELQKHVGKDTRFLGFSVLAMVIFATIIGSSGNCVTNHVTLAYAGVAGALLAILAAFGLLSLMGSKFVNLCGVMPFLVLGKSTSVRI